MMLKDKKYRKFGGVETKPPKFAIFVFHTNINFGTLKANLY